MPDSDVLGGRPGSGASSDRPELPDRRQVPYEVLDLQRFELGEGARWDGSRFWQVDLLRGTLWRSGVGGAGPLTNVLTIDRPLGAIVPNRVGRLVLAGAGVAALDGTRPVWLAEPVAGLATPRRVNDGAACRGRIYFGTMDAHGTAGYGELWRMDTDGSVHRVLEDLGCPNGPVFTADSRRMYLADSLRRLIYRFDVDGDGALLNGAVHTRIPSSLGFPDGMTVDDADRLWVALWGASAVGVITPNGTLTTLIDVPMRQPTSVCLTGEHLIVTSAWKDLGAERGPLDGATIAIPTSAGGRPMDIAAINHPRLT